MAEIKIYRLVYVYDSAEDSGVNFSGWVQVDGMDEILGGLPSSGGVEAIVLGWEEKKLDTEPT